MIVFPPFFFIQYNNAYSKRNPLPVARGVLIFFSGVEATATSSLQLNLKAAKYRIDRDIILKSAKFAYIVAQIELCQFGSWAGPLCACATPTLVGRRIHSAWLYNIVGQKPWLQQGCRR